MTAAGTAPRPTVRAAIDQQQAAMRGALRDQQEIAAALGGFERRVVLTPRLGAVLDPLSRLGRAGSLTLCGHVAWADATFWAAWRPGRLRCAPCLAVVSAATSGIREDNRCDSCRRVTRSTTSMSVLLPAVVVDDGEGPAAPFGPITALFGACAPCRVDITTETP